MRLERIEGFFEFFHRGRNSPGETMADIGIYTSMINLEHKLEQRKDGKGNEATWNMARFPKRLGKGDGPDRLFFAVEGFWCGYFTLAKDILYSPEDPIAPYSLIFDVTTWTEIPTVPVKKFRGFRYLEGIPKREGSQISQEE